jgi:membrane-associated phospholipid phosphatase
VSTPDQSTRTRLPKFRTFVAARFARGEYLGLHLTIGLLVSIGALVVFGTITENVVHHERFTAIDLSFAAWIRAHATPLGDRIGVAISLLGGATAMATICLAVAGVLAYERWWIALAGWIAAFVGGSVLDWELKVIIRRPRPVGAERFLHDASFSFPSGHSMGSLIGYGMLAYVLIAYWPPGARHRTVIASGAGIVAFLVGLSRLYLGVHYLTDVVAGFAAGTLWLAACITGVETARRRRGLIPWKRDL